MSDWMPLYRAFHGDATEFIERFWPRLQVRGSLLTNIPTSADPLALKAKLEMGWDSDTHRVRFVYADEATPWLDPRTLQAYVIVQWPDLFRIRP